MKSKLDMNFTFKLALVGALCAAPTVAHACSCMAPPAPKIALENSAAVFVGRVTSIKEGKMANNYQFAVSKQWKGIAGKTTSIESNKDSAACGIDFEQGRDYLVYASKIGDSEQLRTNLCSRTRLADTATTDLAELGAPKTTALPKSVIYTMDTNNVVQLNADGDSDPLIILGRAVQDSADVSKFRVSWNAPTNVRFNGTAFYNRKDSTLKSYTRMETDAEIEVSSVLYSGVTDEVLQKLASTEKIEEFFRTYADYGVTKKDVGSKTVLISAQRVAPR